LEDMMQFNNECMYVVQCRTV